MGWEQRPSTSVFVVIEHADTTKRSFEDITDLASWVDYVQRAHYSDHFQAGESTLKMSRRFERPKVGRLREWTQEGTGSEDADKDLSYEEKPGSVDSNRSPRDGTALGTLDFAINVIVKDVVNCHDLKGALLGCV